MTKKNTDYYLHLTGGLGNQLFQYFALRSISQGNSSVIDSANGSPRVNKHGLPDLLDFEIESNIIISKKAMPKITKRAIGYTLRSNLNPRIIEKYRLWKIFRNFCASLLITLHYGKILRISSPENLGEDSTYVDPNKSSYLVGYFQGQKWIKSVSYKEKRLFKLKSYSELVSHYIQLSMKENPLIVHIRLGDYVAENGFGTLGKRYYEKALNSHFEKRTYRRIWLFSDEPDKAVDLIPQKYMKLVRVIQNVDLSSAETLEVMRHGQGYIIANSSFSFWGAYLSYSDRPRVIYPLPWFKNINSPRNIAPEEWERIDADF